MTLPISEILRQRLVSRNQRFYAVDNIADVFNEGDKEKLIDELESKFEEVLRSMVIDTDNDPNSNGTARRLSKMYIREIFEGRYNRTPDITSFPNEGLTAYRGMLVVRSEIKSVCSHHHQPVTGICYIGIIPGSKVIGLSKYTRLAQHLARRGTLQEELCNLISQTIIKHTESQDVGVYIAAKHGCCQNRGIMAKSSMTQTTVLSGDFKTPDVKKEFFDNIALQGGIDID